MKELLAPASKKTPEEEALEAVQLSRLSAGPGIAPQTGPPKREVEVDTPATVPAIASPAASSSQPSPPPDPPIEVEPDYVATGDGYFYIRNVDGSFQPQAYYQGPDGRYWPYEG
jgi:hypothetical protein